MAQATAMASLGDYSFVLENLIFTKNNCNGIEVSVCCGFSSDLVHKPTGS